LVLFVSWLCLLIGLISFFVFVCFVLVVYGRCVFIGLFVFRVVSLLALYAVKQMSNSEGTSTRIQEKIHHGGFLSQAGL
jgi:hypothetical protein